MNTFRKFACSVVVSLLAVPSFVSAADTFVIDGSHASVIFGISHMGFSYTYGRFNEVKGAYVLDGQNPAGAQFQLDINANSVDTNNQKRDDHLRSPDFFNVKQFPVISFQSKSVAVEQVEKDTVYKVTGDLTMHGVTRQVTLPLKKLNEGPGMGGEVRSGFVCQTSLKRSEFGMTNMIPGVGDDVTVIVSFEGVRQDAAPAR